MIRFLKMNEAGSEEVTTVEGNEQPDLNPDSENFDYEAWLEDDSPEYDEDEDEEEVEIEEKEEEIKPEEEEKEEENKEDEEEKVEEKEEDKPNEPNKLQLKISKGEIEHDLSNIELTTRMLQQGYDAQEKWQEAAKIRNQSNQFMNTLKKDPRSILENPAMGIDIVKLAEEVLYERYEEENMSPAEKKLRAENRELKAAQYKKEIEAQEKAANDRKAQQERTMQNINETLDKLGMPKSQDNINRTIQYMRQAIEAGLTNVTPESVMDYVKRDFAAEQQSYVQGMEVEALLDFLGKDKVEALRKHYVSQIKPAPVKPKVPKEAPKKKESKEPKYSDLADFLGV